MNKCNFLVLNFIYYQLFFFFIQVFHKIFEFLKLQNKELIPKINQFIETNFLLFFRMARLLVKMEILLEMICLRHNIVLKRDKLVCMLIKHIVVKNLTNAGI